MVDAHCHLADSRYPIEELEEIIKRADEAGAKMISNGTGLKNSKTTVEIAKAHKNVWACVGLAYDRSSKNWESIKRELMLMCQDKKVVGIGEAGLDYYEGMSEDLKNYQRELLITHIKTANYVGLPIQIHNRRADEDLLEILKEAKVPVMMHCFNRDVEFMNKCIERGWHISLGGLVTYKNSKKLLEAAKVVPLDKLLLETDAPYLAPEPVRGSVNEPRNVKIVAEVIASLKGISTESLGEITERNARKLFKKIYD